MTKLNNRRKVFLKSLYQDGYRFIARDGKRSDSKIRAYVVEPSRMQNELQETWDAKWMGSLELIEDGIIISGILEDVKWLDVPLDIKEEIG